MEQRYQKLIDGAYAAFNARDIDAVLASMHENVRWLNGWEGGYVYGHKEVREYWMRQWKELNPEVKPVFLKEIEDGRIEVEVHQKVKDLEGKEVFNGIVKHVYTFDEGLIQSMEIEKA